jgi:hypothetical protein
MLCGNCCFHGNDIHFEILEPIKQSNVMKDSGKNPPPLLCFHGNAVKIWEIDVISADLLRFGITINPMKFFGGVSTYHNMHIFEIETFSKFAILKISRLHCTSRHQ